MVGLAKIGGQDPNSGPPVFELKTIRFQPEKPF
jgi:hypothetical protein